MALFTVNKKIQTESRIKKSRFIATLLQTSSPDEVKIKIKKTKDEFKDATHHPYAYRLGHTEIIERYSDDGEPPKSSGFPVLQELKRANLTNTLLIVTRYFGGIKLGLGGLNRAYRESARIVIETSKKIVYVPTVEMAFRVDRKIAGKMRNLLKHYDARVLKEEYANKIFLKVSVEEKNKQTLLEALKNLTHGKIDIEQ